MRTIFELKTNDLDAMSNDELNTLFEDTRKRSGAFEMAARYTSQLFELDRPDDQASTPKGTWDNISDVTAKGYHLNDVQTELLKWAFWADDN